MKVTLTDWMRAKWNGAEPDQREQFALLTAQYVDSFQSTAWQLIDDMNAAKDTAGAQAALETFVKRCDFQGENLQQSILSLAGEAGSQWPTKN